MGRQYLQQSYHSRPAVVSLDVVRQVGSGQILDVSCGSKDCTAEGAVLKSGGVEVIEEHLFHLLLNLKSHEINAKSTRNQREILRGRQLASATFLFIAIEVDRQSCSSIGLQPCVRLCTTASTDLVLFRRLQRKKFVVFAHIPEASGTATCQNPKTLAIGMSLAEFVPLPSPSG